MKPNSPAFPGEHIDRDALELLRSHRDLFSAQEARALAGRHPGMTLRQYVAIHSPVSLVDANESLHQTTKFGKPENDGAFPMRQVVAESVRLSVMYADMLLAELAKDQGTAEVAQSLSDKDPA